MPVIFTALTPITSNHFTLIVLFRTQKGSTSTKCVTRSFSIRLAIVVAAAAAENALLSPLLSVPAITISPCGDPSLMF